MQRMKCTEPKSTKCGGRAHPQEASDDIGEAGEGAFTLEHDGVAAVHGRRSCVGTLVVIDDRTRPDRVRHSIPVIVLD